MRARPCSDRVTQEYAWHCPWISAESGSGHVRRNSAGNWRELQKRAAREGAPLDALFLDAEEKWLRVSDLAPDHEIHAALAQDRERRR